MKPYYQSMNVDVWLTDKVMYVGIQFIHWCSSCLLIVGKSCTLMPVQSQVTRLLHPCPQFSAASPSWIKFVHHQSFFVSLCPTSRVLPVLESALWCVDADVYFLIKSNIDDIAKPIIIVCIEWMASLWIQRSCVVRSRTSGWIRLFHLLNHPHVPKPSGALAFVACMAPPSGGYRP